MKKIVSLITLLTFVLSFNGFAGDSYTDDDIRVAVAGYQAKMEWARKEFNTRTNKRLLKDLNYAADEITTALANMAVYLDAVKAFQILAKETAGTQLDLTQLARDLLSGNAVNTEGLTYTIPSFTAEKPEDWCLPSEAMANADNANRKLDKLVKLVEKKKKRAQRGRGGVSADSEVVRVYNTYITNLRAMSALVNELKNGLSSRINEVLSELHVVAGQNAKLLGAINHAARHFAVIRIQLKHVEKLLINSLPTSDSTTETSNLF